MKVVIMTNCPQKPKKILIVDDEPGGLDWVLKTYGYETEIATDGQEGINKATSSSQFDLAIIDLVMPTMTGFNLIKKFRKLENTRTIPIIVLTSFNSKQNHITSLNIGADDYITKPFEASTLIARIESIFRRIDWCKDHKNIQNKSTAKNKKQLTRRQLEILNFMSQGYSNKIIAEKLVLSETTIKAHLRTIFKKLKVTNRTQAVFEGIKIGLINSVDL